MGTILFCYERDFILSRSDTNQSDGIEVLSQMSKR